jgi:hypothetical protein
MKESTAAFIAIATISSFVLIFMILVQVSLSVERWEDENCPLILAQEASDVHWRDVRRCGGYGR